MLLADFVTSALLLGAVSTTPDQLPYWATTNRFGLMPEGSGAVALVQAGMDYDRTKDFQWHWNASIGVNTNRFQDCKFLPDEAYFGIKWRPLKLDVGFQHQELDYYGADKRLGSLSTTGGHYIESGNALSMPGYTLRLDNWSVPGTKDHLILFGAFGDYVTLDDRYVKRALVHRTEFGLRVNVWKFFASAGIEHRAMWGGTHPVYGQLPQGIDDYFRMLIGKPGGDNAAQIDQANVIGNQLGSIHVGLGFKGQGWTVSLKHDAPYDDKSGMRWENFPDGVNTLCFSFEDKNRWVTDIVYEFIYTMNQSGSRHDNESGKIEPGQVSSGNDDYFNNAEYRSGWTYWGRIIGLPLYTVRTPFDPEYKNFENIENNRIIAHHIGLGGKLFRKFPYRLMITYTDNYGTYNMDYFGYKRVWGVKKGDSPQCTAPEVPLGQFYCGLDAEFPIALGFGIVCGLYGDAGDQRGGRFGATLGLRYTFLKK